jgi:hypothetical protein
VDYFSLAIFVITFLLSLRLAFWPGADDFSWEMDWRGLYVREYRAKSAYRAAQELSPALT